MCWRVPPPGRPTGSQSAQVHEPSSVHLRQGNSGEPFGPGSSLQSPLRSDFRCDPFRLRSQARCALRLPRKAGPSMGIGVLLPTYAHCPTRAQCANPASGRVLHSASLRSGRDSQGNGAGAPSPIGARDRGSVASLPAPAPLAHTDGPCPAAPVAPLRAREPIGTRRKGPALQGHKAHLSHSCIRRTSCSISTTLRLSQSPPPSARTRSSTARPPSATSSTPGTSGTRTTRRTR